ncbi:hypothetical protein NLG97_g123 [Lecanicillium saksenae]|uniref:Uncharacterized protein n=1 Tax=Lecanicillium saksenae TaxID=468837 RepID=A0ACC1R9D8_9HYPO|nr:hypothetical protein NLG97_g123 [Lecanicillium saksenae]
MPRDAGGEIAIRILQAARELPDKVQTYALYLANDRSHCDIGKPEHSIQIPSASSFLCFDTLIDIAKKHSIDCVHPGYGFLSEDANFARRMWDEANCIVVGPGWATLARTGDKIQANLLAQECHVPVLTAMSHATSDVRVAREFALRVGLPIMVKAVDGGIRLIRHEKDLEAKIKRALSESPACSVFVEKAAVDSFRHVEVQIVGDGTGRVRHLWERDCSAQRLFQKVVECAPSLISDRLLIADVIGAALRMASAIRYQSLGTFEFLVSETTGQFYFLEINPRLQVEHTITECISGVDLVRAQLLIAQGCSLADVGLGEEIPPHQPSPTAFSIQFRLCAEYPEHDFALSVGNVTSLYIPSGQGIRGDTHIHSHNPLIVGSDFDNLLAKIIVTAISWNAVTNITLLRGIAIHPDFVSGRVDTQWLEANLNTILHGAAEMSQTAQGPGGSSSSVQQAMASELPASGPLFRKGDAWSLNMQLFSSTETDKSEVAHNHLRVTRVLRNDFPNFLAADIEYTSTTSPSPASYRMELRTTTASAGALVSSLHRRGDASNPLHIMFPIPGKLMEILVSKGEVVAENQPLALIKQMKMELEIRSPKRCKVKWVYEIAEEDEDVADGVLLVELEPDVTKETGPTGWKL